MVSVVEKDNSVSTPVLVIVMGVSGCGKTTIGQLLAEKLQVPFIDGDQLHSTSNIEKMHYGIPLNDDDRLEWLQKISATLSEQWSKKEGAVIGCSALKIKYRRILRGFCLNYDPSTTPPAESPLAQQSVNFLHLRGSFELLSKRMESRGSHFMPPSLLQSQFDTLEVPTQEEHMDQEQGRVRGKLVEMPIDMDPNEIVEKTFKILSS